MIVESFRNDTALTKISEMFMVTRGEWALKSLVVSKHNMSKDEQTQSKVVYTVRKRCPPRPDRGPTAAPRQCV